MVVRREHGWTVVHVDFAAGGTPAAALDVLLHKVTDTLADGSAAARAEAEAIWVREGPPWPHRRGQDG